MIDAIIFDFGDVFINLDKQGCMDALKALGISQWDEDLDQLNKQYEVGALSEEAFLEGLQKHSNNASINDIREAWNAILADFPLYRLEFLQLLSKKYRLFLLSNTDAIHIRTFEQKTGPSFYGAFYQCFEKVYFSFEMGLRKPDAEAYHLIVNQNGLQPKHSLFVDDKTENTAAAAALGFAVWNLEVGKDDVVELFDKTILTEQ